MIKQFGDIWQQGTYPEEWMKALTILIQKSGKDPENPETYRPISLTRCLGNVMEKMINRRLVYILEERKQIWLQMR
jgi:hypothetical protein